MIQLAGATVVITGASSGIGLATALAFARRGANLVLAARGQDALDAAAAECESLGAHTLAVPTDVTDAAAVRRLAELAAQRFSGRIDVWVNNAGVGAIGAFEQTPVEAHEQVVRVNLLGYLNGAHAVLPFFKAQRSGVLVNNISLGAWMSTPYASAYSASKFALRGFSESLRGELQPWPGIHVCDVFPSGMDTPGFSHAANYTSRELKPPGPMYDPRRVAEVIVQLAANPRRPARSVGAPARLARLSHWLAPRLCWRLMGQAFRSALVRAERGRRSDGTLFQPHAGPPTIDGGWRSEPAKASALPALGLAVGALGLLALVIWQRQRLVGAARSLGPQARHLLPVVAGLAPAASFLAGRAGAGSLHTAVSGLRVAGPLAATAHLVRQRPLLRPADGGRAPGAGASA